MEIASNGWVNIDVFISTVEKNSEFVREPNGLSKMAIDDDLWEELKYQMFLKTEIKKGKMSLKNEPTLSIDDFAKRIGM